MSVIELSGHCRDIALLPESDPQPTSRVHIYPLRHIGCREGIGVSAGDPDLCSTLGCLRVSR